MASDLWGHRLLSTMILSVSAVATLVPCALAQGPSSRGSFSGPTIQRRVPLLNAEGEQQFNAYGEPEYAYETVSAGEVPIPDLFRMEAPFVERNFRLDYLYTNHLREPEANESQFFGELRYSFTERLGILISSPLLIRNNLVDEDATGFGDLETGVRYVAIGYEEEDTFKMAFGLNVISPTGNEERELGEGTTFLEPEVLMLQKLPRDSFFQTQLALETPTESGQATVFGYSFGFGRVHKSSNNNWFRNPTPTIELNCETGIGGIDAGMSIVDLTPGLRWMIGGKTFAGVALSVPLASEREFETQYILSLIHQYGREQPSASSAGAPSSRAAF